jgi:hypothetical protein
MRWRLTFALTLSGLMAGAAIAAPSPETAPELLPDLTIQAPRQVSVAASDGRYALGFHSAADNVGGGPLIVDGERRTGSSKMTTRQVIRRPGRSDRSRAREAKLRFVVSKDHSHWHYDGFMRYELREAGSGKLVAPDRKTGFCLGDRYETDPSHELAGEPSRPPYTGRCGLGKPKLTRLRQGISVGYGDDYPAHLEGQEIDLSGVPAGSYRLVHRVNPARTLLESNYANNASSALVHVTRPRGPEGRPVVKLIARCEGSDRCS